MALPDDGFIAIDEDAAAPDRPEDTWLDNALRYNLERIRELGWQVTWAPRTDDADDFNQKLGIQTYAGLAYVSILSVPWIVDEGAESYRVRVHYRASDEHSAGLSSFGRITLANVASQRFEFSNTDANSPQWSFAGDTLTLPTPQDRAILTDLRIEMQSTVAASSPITTSIGRYDFSALGGAVDGTDTGDAGYNVIFDGTGSTAPDAADRGVMVLEDTQVDSDSYYDILWVGSSDDALLRPQGTSYRGGSTSVQTIPQSYVQVRGVEIQAIFEGDTHYIPAGRYAPWRTVEGRDAVAHPLAQNASRSRWRPMWLGPVGRFDADEAFPDGYGERFARAHGDDKSAQRLFTASITPRHPDPTIRVLLNLIPTWSSLLSTHGGIGSYEQLQEAAARVSWTLGFNLRRFEDGGATPTDVITATETVELTTWPQAVTPISPALAAENRLAVPVTGVLREGQLYPEDHILLQRVDVALDLTVAGARGLDPYTLEVTALVDAIVEVPDEAEETTITATNLRLTCTGASIWEQPT